MLTTELYNQQYLSRGDCPMWVCHDGPQFTQGKSHVGNMYNRMLKDMINRYKLLRGYRVHHLVGFDCFGNHVEDTFSDAAYR